MNMDYEAAMKAAKAGKIRSLKTRDFPPRLFAGIAEIEVVTRKGVVSATVLMPSDSYDLYQAVEGSIVRCPSSQEFN